jgi:hypothetical protein
MSDIGYPTKVHSDIRYNVGLKALQSDIGRSDIRLSPISLITDIGLSAHLCPSITNGEPTLGRAILSTHCDDLGTVPAVCVQYTVATYYYCTILANLNCT